MKVHLLQVLIIDHDALGVDEVERVLEDANYPNHCIAPSVVKSQSVSIGDWDDDNPLNHSDTQVAEVDRLFNSLRPMKDAPIDKREYILLFGESGYITTPLRCEVCRHSSWGGWTNHAGDLFIEGGSEPVGWLPLPQARC
jgi:hypothetical protein